MPKHYPDVAEKRAHLRKEMQQLVQMFGSNVRVQTLPNSMLAGPCNGCTALASAPHLARTVPLMPLDECPHPDQCAGLYRMVLDLD